MILSPQGVYYQIGDVVSVIDEQDGKPYYAQIRGFIQDQYCEKSAALTWLLPTLSSPRDHFDPASYIIGESAPRSSFLSLPACPGLLGRVCASPCDTATVPRRMVYAVGLDFLAVPWVSGLRSGGRQGWFPVRAPSWLVGDLLLVLSVWGRLCV